MKYITILLFLVSCGEGDIQIINPFSGPKFKVGDCFASNGSSGREFLKDGVNYRKILKVGERNYLYEFHTKGLLNEASIGSIDRFNKKVDCPEDN